MQCSEASSSMIERRPHLCSSQRMQHPPLPQQYLQVGRLLLQGCFIVLWGRTVIA
jgi:hypothetical protein